LGCKPSTGFAAATTQSRPLAASFLLPSFGHSFISPEAGRLQLICADNDAAWDKGAIPAGRIERPHLPNAVVRRRK